MNYIQPIVILDGMTVELDDLAHRLKNGHSGPVDRVVAAELIEKFVIPLVAEPKNGD